jgi:hypothetical protein
MVQDTNGLIREISQREPGTTIRLQLVRANQLIVSPVELTDPTATPKTAAPPIDGKPEAEVKPGQQVAGSGESILEGVGKKLGGLFTNPNDSDVDLLPPPAQTPSPNPKPADAEPLAAGKPTTGDDALATADDALALGDDEPIDQVIFDAFPVEAEELAGPRETEELPSSQPPEKKESEAERIARLEAEIRRLKEKLETLEEPSGEEQKD